MEPLCPLNSQTLTELYSELLMIWKLAMQETTADDLRYRKSFFFFLYIITLNVKMNEI